MNPHLKMVAKVAPTVRKEDKPESEDEDLSIDSIKVGKKQAFPWLFKFTAICVDAMVTCCNYERLDHLMDIYIR